MATGRSGASGWIVSAGDEAAWMVHRSAPCRCRCHPGESAIRRPMTLFHPRRSPNWSPNGGRTRPQTGMPGSVEGGCDQIAAYVGTRRRMVEPGLISRWSGVRNPPSQPNQ